MSAKPKIVSDYLPNLWQERAANLIDTVVIHAMHAGFAYPDEPFSIGYCRKIFIEYGVSAHYVIGRNGEIFAWVPEEKKAWHAGVSKMPDPDGREGVNDFSIGIELIGNEELPFSEEQYSSLNFLLADIKSRRFIKRIVGHEHIAGKELVERGLRAEAKWDPGRMFDWGRVKG